MHPMLPDGRRLGAHLPLATGMVKAVDRAREIGANAMQIFSDNPTAWKRRAEPPRELAAFRQRLDELDIGVVSIHASYLVNLAGSNAESVERSIVMLAHELRQAHMFGARYVNVHIGSHLGLGVPAGIERLADGSAFGGCSSGVDWRMWDGTRCGYEGLLTDQFGVLVPALARWGNA